MPRLWLDLETFSAVPIKNGTHAYADGAEIMLMQYALDDGPVWIWDRVNGELRQMGGPLRSTHGDTPEELDRWLADPAVEICAHNAAFERTVMQHAGTEIERCASEDVHRWRCTMAQALAHSLPGGLEKLCEVLKVSQDQAKLKTGRALIQLFCKPRPAKQKLRRATRETHPDEWEQFVQYAGMDIVAMRACAAAMPIWNYKGRELDLFHLDARINDRGVAIDLDLARAAIAAAEKAGRSLAEQTDDLTDGDVASATQRDALMAHILDTYGVALPDMRAATLERRIEDPDLPDPVRALLVIRLQAGRISSVRKFSTLLRATSGDGRLRGLLQFCGAGRTGRWSGRLFQPQNLARPDLNAIARHYDIALMYSKYQKLRSAPGVGEAHVRGFIDQGIAALKAGVADLGFDDVMALAASVVRGAIVAPPGRKLVVSDLANIEGRVAAWLAGERWKLTAFAAYDAGTGPDLYKLAYAKAFGVSPDAVDKAQRQIGKVMELMLQYEGGVGAYLTGALTYGIDLEEMAEQAHPTLPADLREKAEEFLTWWQSEKRGMLGLTERAFVVCTAFKIGWRRAHPAIAGYWPELLEAIREAALAPGVTITARRLKVRRDGTWLRVGLPSGRALCYPGVQVAANGQVSYMGLNQYSRQWQRLPSYGGKFFENVCQAVARDVMAHNMPAIEDAGYALALSVHDELVTETPDTPDYSPEALGRLLAAVPPWAPGLPLAAGGYEDYRYRKE